MKKYSFGLIGIQKVSSYIALLVLCTVIGIGTATASGPHSTWVRAGSASISNLSTAETRFNSSSPTTLRSFVRDASIHYSGGTAGLQSFGEGTDLDLVFDGPRPTSFVSTF